ncbi:ABC transporter permease [Candidatus Kapaibacterium sp.]
MNLLFKIAWRNIWRNWRRSVLTMLAVVFAVFFINVMKGIQTGTFEANIRYTLNLFSGHIQIQKEGFQDNPTLNKAFSLDLEMLGKLQNDEYIRGFCPRITSFGLIGKNEKSLGTAIIGIDPTAELLNSEFPNRIKDGIFVSSVDENIINVGERMLKNLNAKLGDTVVILSQAFDGTMGNKKFVIGGVFRFGNNEFDGMTIFMNIKAADELLAMNNKINSLAVFIDNLDNLDIASTNLKSLAKSKVDKGIVVLPWFEVLRDLKQTVDMKVIGEIFYVLILLMIVGFGILNTVLMSITERFREFGVMLALGTRHYIIVLSVFIETIIISLLGISIGTLFAYLLNSYFAKNPFMLKGDFTKLYEELGYLPEIYSSVSTEIFTSTAILIFSVSILVYIYPAFRLYKLTALKGIRYT